MRAGRNLAGRARRHRTRREEKRPSGRTRSTLAPTCERSLWPYRVIAFSDDLTCPPHLCAEAAEAIPECDFIEIGSCGHVGYLERPDEVNSVMIEFLDKH